MINLRGKESGNFSIYGFGWEQSGDQVSKATELLQRESLCGRQLCVQNSLWGLRVSRCHSESRLEKGCFSVWRTREDEGEQAGRLRQAGSAKGCEDLRHACVDGMSVQRGRYQTWPCQPCQLEPHMVPTGLTCCSSEWNGSHINIMRKRNAGQGERNEEFIWAQTWARGDAQLLLEMARALGGGGCPCPKCWLVGAGLSGSDIPEASIQSWGEDAALPSRFWRPVRQSVSSKESSSSQDMEAFLSAQACLSSKLLEANINNIKTSFETVKSTPKGDDNDQVLKVPAHPPCPQAGITPVSLLPGKSK